MATFNDFNSSTLARAQSTGEVSTRDVLPLYPQFTGWLEDELASPESDAVEFYMTNHGMSLLRAKVGDGPLGKYTDLVEDYYVRGSLMGLRMYWYLMIICIRESRHERAFISKLYDEYPELSEWHKNRVDDSSAHNSIVKFTESVPDVPMGRLLEFVYRCFKEGGLGTGYGGLAWAAVVKPLKQFVDGTISLEILLDTAFTLEHNGGAIFNKGMLYKGPHESRLKKILDVQKSGQIPRYYPEFRNTFKPSERLETLYKRYQDILPHAFSGEVDWKYVEACKHASSEATQAEPAQSSLDLSDPATPDSYEVYLSPKVWAKKSTQVEFLEASTMYPLTEADNAD